MLKKYALIIAIGYTLALVIASLAKVKDVPDLGISFADKIFHFGAYAMMTVIWFNYFFTLKMTTKAESIIIAVIIAVILGMIIELLQGTITESRQADFNDVIANNIGILIAAVILWFLPTKDVKKY